MYIEPLVCPISLPNIKEIPTEKIPNTLNPKNVETSVHLSLINFFILRGFFEFILRNFIDTLFHNILTCFNTKRVTFLIYSIMPSKW